MRFATYALCGGLDGELVAGYFRGANVDIGAEYLLASIAVVVIGGASVSGGKANLPGVWGAALFLVLLLTMLGTFGVSAGVRLLLTGLIVAVITAAGGGRREADALANRRVPCAVRRASKDLNIGKLLRAFELETRRVWKHRAEFGQADSSDARRRGIRWRGSDLDMRDGEFWARDPCCRLPIIIFGGNTSSGLAAGSLRRNGNC